MIIDFCQNTIKELKQLTGEEYAKVYCDRRMEFCRKFQHGLSVSTNHGSNFFQNVLDFIRKPDIWLEQFEDISEYEKNFVKILKYAC